MSKKRDNQVNEQPDLKQRKDSVLLAIRQYFYKNGQYNENLIKTLERAYFDNKKSEDEWEEILTNKKIIFK